MRIKSCTYPRPLLISQERKEIPAAKFTTNSTTRGVIYSLPRARYHGTYSCESSHVGRSSPVKRSPVIGRFRRRAPALATQWPAIISRAASAFGRLPVSHQSAGAGRWSAPGRQLVLGLRLNPAVSWVTFDLPHTAMFGDERGPSVALPRLYAPS